MLETIGPHEIHILKVFFRNVKVMEFRLMNNKKQIKVAGSQTKKTFHKRFKEKILEQAHTFKQEQMNRFVNFVF